MLVFSGCSFSFVWKSSIWTETFLILLVPCAGLVCYAWLLFSVSLNVIVNGHCTVNYYNFKVGDPAIKWIHSFSLAYASLRCRAIVSEWVILFVRKDLAKYTVHLGNSESAERVWVLLHNDLGPILIGLWYRPMLWWVGVHFVFRCGVGKIW